MKRLYLCALVLLAFTSRAAAAEKTLPQDKSANMERVCRFIKEAGWYSLATVDGDQPRVRPFGTIHVYDGKLYVQTGKKKAVARQLAGNGKVEICVRKGDEWIRLSGTLVPDERREAKASMLDAYPELKKMYSPDDGNTLVLYFTGAKATIHSFRHPSVTLEL